MAFFAGLLAAVATRGLDRRLVVMRFSTLLILPNLLVASAPHLSLLLLARVVPGLCRCSIAAAGRGLAGLYAGWLVQVSLVALWDLAFGTMPVAWSTWLARAVPDKAESGGALIIATPLAITICIPGRAPS